MNIDKNTTIKNIINIDYMDKLIERQRIIQNIATGNIDKNYGENILNSEELKE